MQVSINIKSTLLFGACAIAGTCVTVQAQSIEQSAMQECATQAEHASLKGDARKDFMRACMPAARARLANMPRSQAVPDRQGAVSGQAQPWASCDGTTVVMEACVEKAQKVVETELNLAYARALRSLPKASDSSGTYAQVRRNLVEAQRAWVLFRQKDCDAVYALAIDGSARGLEYLGCMRIHAERRIEDLKVYFDK
jgi:uncharacterized protein YecT (DUF1311 family)